MSVTEEFRRHFRGLEAVLKIEGTLTEDTSTNFDILLQMCTADRDFAKRLSEYGGFRTQLLRNHCGDLHIRTKSKLEISTQVIDLIFHALVSSVGYRYPKINVPKVHHWLPISYTRAFAITKAPVPGSRKRSCSIQGLTFTHEGESIEKSVSDSHFAHGVDADGNGFYNLNAEYFFCKIESKFAESRQRAFHKDNRQKAKGKDIFPNVCLTAFFIVQSVRNPHPDSAQFSIRSFNGVVEGLIAALEQVPTIYTMLASTNSRMAFTPYVPTRILRMTDGNRALIFPVGPHQALIVSDQQMIGRDVRKLAEGSNAAVISHARRNGSMVFGIGHNDLQV